MIASPQANAAPVVRRLAADEEVVGIECRPQRPKLETLDDRGGQLMAQQIEQQCRDQRSVNDESGITLHRCHIASIEMDSVPVQRQCRIAKQQHVVGHPLLFPFRRCRRSFWWRRNVVRLWRVAIDDVVKLDECRVGLVVPTNLVTNLDEDQRTGATGFLADVHDRRCPGDRVADVYGCDEFQLAAGPHPSRQRDRRKKAPALGVPVGTDLRLSMQWKEVQPVPQRRQRRAPRRSRGIAVECRR